eukprot:scaffold1388_cov390-Prasinococcus_capsulatus_cf.AAC.16
MVSTSNGMVCSSFSVAACAALSKCNVCSLSSSSTSLRPSGAARRSSVFCLSSASYEFADPNQNELRTALRHQYALCLIVKARRGSEPWPASAFAAPSTWGFCRSRSCYSAAPL